MSWRTPFASSGTSTPRYSLHPLVPDLRQVAELDAVVDDVLLELEAQDDVHAVGHLVRLDADQRRLHAVDPGKEASSSTSRQLLRETPSARAGRRAPERCGYGRRGSPTGGSATRGCRGKAPIPYMHSKRPDADKIKKIFEKAEKEEK